MQTKNAEVVAIGNSSVILSTMHTCVKSCNQSVSRNKALQLQWAQSFAAGVTLPADTYIMTIVCCWLFFNTEHCCIQWSKRKHMSSELKSSPSTQLGSEFDPGMNDYWNHSVVNEGFERVTRIEILSLSALSHYLKNLVNLTLGLQSNNPFSALQRNQARASYMNWNLITLTSESLFTKPD